MSNFRCIHEKCSVCGTVSKQRIMISSSSFGSCDLDMRPAPILRNTMSAWVHECPKCGYTAPHLADKSTVSKEWLNLRAYKTCDGIDLSEELARKFYKRYLVLSNEGPEKERPALWALIRAAWVCDDAKDTKTAKTLREKAVEEVSRIIENQDRNSGVEDFYLIRYDLMRRAGMFDEVISLCEKESFRNGDMEKVRKFQMEKAKAKDAGCYMYDSALKE